VLIELEREPQEIALGLEQNERLAGLWITQHSFDERDRIGAPTLKRSVVELSHPVATSGRWIAPLG
jgi:hypothetical protein